jgi:RimJ/RimL family protein N-acetyltransferase
VIPALETERLILRESRESDLDALAAFYADAELSKFVGGPLDRDDTWRRIAMGLGHWRLRGFGDWALEEKATGDYIGWCALWSPEGFPGREVGWGLVKAKHGRGFATEAARRARDFAYLTLGWDTAISLIALGNDPSVRVARRLGAVFESFTKFRGMDCAIYRHPPARSLASNATPPDQKEELSCR